MAYQIFTLPKQVLLASSAVQAGYKVYFYLTGTTTATPVYSDSALTTPITQPVTADAAGVLQTVYLNPSVVYKASVYNSSDVLQYTVDPVNDAPSVASTAITYAQTAAEISAGVTPTDYSYPPGDVRRYGVTTESTAAQVAAAVQAALSSHGSAFIPQGEWNWDPVLFAAGSQRIVGSGRGVTVLNYAGTGTAIDFAGFDFCSVENLRLEAPSAAVGIDVGDIAHWWTLRNLVINGSSTGSDTSGTVGSGTGVQCERSYYGTMTGCDVAFFTKGLYGFREFNGNAIFGNSFRQNLRGVHISDATANTEGSQIFANQIESAEASTVAGVDIEGADSISVAHNRIELTTASQASIYVHGGTGASVRCDLDGNMIVGTVAAVKIGSGSGSNNVQRCRIRGGYYNGSVTINSDADYTVSEVDRRFIEDGSTALVNNSTTSILSYVDDSGFTVGITGLTTSPTATWKFQIAKGVVTLFAQTLNGTSNSTGCTITGLPALIRPTNTQTVLCLVQDNGVTTSSKGGIDSSGVLTLYKDANGSAFTNSGSKGFIGCAITYPLN